ncbi:MAG: hypothetical protein M5U28_37630 [Sandaracinaceae bacterium]|nr:hypothetical protein [Sandaracinaceae bacterium]
MVAPPAGHPLVFAAERLLVDPRLRAWDYRGEPFGRGVERWYFAAREPDAE